MDEPAFDAEALFDEDYLYFYEELLSDAKSDAETELIWRLLQLEPGMQVLDLACGHGRIANRLAARGCRVTGLDSTPLFLDHAGRDAVELGVAVDYVEGDMRALPWTQHFDRVINWFSAFGYFDDPDNRRVLTEIARVLKPGGRVAFELMNRDRLVREFQPDRVAAERGGDLIIDRTRLDPLTSRALIERIVLRAGRVRRIPFFVRLFTFTELRDWLLAAGFASIAAYSEDATPLAMTNRRMVVTAQR
ncbi:MAG: class I SAM-dependent methyltransferase [Frankiaceae bacterium]